MKNVVELDDLIQEMQSFKDSIKTESSNTPCSNFIMLSTIVSFGTSFIIEQPMLLGITLLLARMVEGAPSIEKAYNRSYPLSSLSEETQLKLKPFLSKLHELGVLKEIDLTSSIDTFLNQLSSLINSKAGESAELKSERKALNLLESQLAKLGLYSAPNNQNLINRLTNHQNYESQLAFNLH